MKTNKRKTVVHLIERETSINLRVMAETVARKIVKGEVQL